MLSKSSASLRSPLLQSLLRAHWITGAIYLLATAQLAGTYYFLEYNYLDYKLFEHGYERLPFQTRLLLAPFLRWADGNSILETYALRLSHSTYFFPSGVGPQDIFLFCLNIFCLLLSGWIATRIYHAASRRELMGAFVYPIFLVLCAVTYVLHTVQNFRFAYDFPSLALFSIGLYLIYFRKPVLLFVALFAIATLNRETSLFLLLFYACSASLDANGNFSWKLMTSTRTLTVVIPLAAYWAAWHLMIFHMFRGNASEYYPRVHFNLHVLGNLKYYPQVFSALSYLPVFLFLYRKRLADSQLRAWLWILPVWLAFMFFWAILPETRVFGELIPYVACVSAILVEEVIVARMGMGPSERQPEKFDDLEFTREVEELDRQAV